MPDLSGGYKKLFGELESMAQNQRGAGETLYPIRTISYYLSADDAKAEANDGGQVLAATEMQVLDRDGDAIRVAVNGWQQDGVDRVIYALRGQRIFEMTLRPTTVENLERLGTETDPNTDLVWHQVSLEAWIRPEDVVGDIDAIWAYTSEMYSAACGTCHSAGDPAHHLANQWIGIMKAMERFVALDKEEYRVLQKYLQLRAKDTGGTH
jgi:trimethylamine-N-oxide reductase cytochrome c-type subunit TorC